jgi:hypothetical protein
VPLIFSVLFIFLSSVSGLPLQNTQQQTPTHRIALSFANDDFVPSEQQLAIATELDIRLFEISDPATADILTDPRFRFLIDAGIDFPVPGLLSDKLGSVSTDITLRVEEFRQHTGDRIAAISVFRYPFETYAGFTQLATSLIDSLSPRISTPLFYYSAFPDAELLPGGFNFTSKRADPSQIYQNTYPVMHVVPSTNQYATYSLLNSMFNGLQSVEESITILPARWFFNEIEKRSELRYLFSDFTSGNPITFPLPEEPESAPFMNWSVVLLLFVWGSFALHFRYQPIYSQSMTRYFSNHSFFVNDVMENRLRNVLPGFILLIQHALLTGLFVFACVEVFVSSLGLEIIRFYFQPLMLLESTILSLFISAVLVAVLLEMVSVFWIYISNKKLTSFSQILNLYSWPLHLNLLVVTFLVVFNRVGFDEIWTLILGAVFILIWFFSFNIAAIDSSKFLENGRTLFLSGTVGVHMLVMIGIFMYLLYSPSILEPILFAIEVP